MIQLQFPGESEDNERCCKQWRRAQVPPDCLPEPQLGAPLEHPLGREFDIPMVQLEAIPKDL